MQSKIVVLMTCYLLTGCSYFQNNGEVEQHSPEKETTPARGRSDKAKAETLTNLGAAYYQQGKYEYALENLKKAQKLDNTNGLTYQVLALIQIRKFHPEAARKLFLKAMTIAPEDMNILTNYAVFLYENDEKVSALIEFEKIASSPFFGNKWTAFTYLGLYDLQSKQRRAAEVNFYKALRSNPNHAPALIEMAKIRYAKRELMSARGFIERYFSNSGAKKPLEGLILAIKIERGLGDRQMVAEYQLVLARTYPFSDEAEQIKYNKTVN